MIRIRRMMNEGRDGQLGVKQYMNANHPEIKDFNGNMSAFKYETAWFYPVASRPATRRFFKIDGKIDYSQWCSDFSRLIYYDYDRFYDMAKRFGFGNCDVFACRVNNKIHYLIPTGSMLAEFPITYGVYGNWQAAGEFRTSLERKLNVIFDSAENKVRRAPATSYGPNESRSSRGGRAVNESQIRPRGGKSLDRINRIAENIMNLGGTNVWWDSKFRILWAADSHEDADYYIYEIKPDTLILYDPKEKYPNLEIQLGWLSEHILDMILQDYIKECDEQLTDEAFRKVMQ